MEHGFEKGDGGGLVMTEIFIPLEPPPILGCSLSVSLGAGFQLFRIYGEARYCSFRNNLKEKFLNRWNQDIRHRFLSKTVQFVGHGILETFEFSLFLFP